jgi:hypothetical protein
MNSERATSGSTSTKYRRVALLATMLAAATLLAVPHLTARALKIWAGVFGVCYLARLNADSVQSL